MRQRRQRASELRCGVVDAEHQQHQIRRLAQRQRQQARTGFTAVMPFSPQARQATGRCRRAARARASWPASAASWASTPTPATVDSPISSRRSGARPIPCPPGRSAPRRGWQAQRGRRVAAPAARPAAMRRAPGPTTARRADDSQFDLDRLGRPHRLGPCRLDRLSSRASATPMRRWPSDLRLAEQAQRGVLLGQRGAEVGEGRPAATRPSTRITAEADGPNWRIAGIGRPRMARACRANSDRSWEISVTRPVSCGRGDTSLNHTWSPLMNSSTPNRPRPPRASVTARAIRSDSASASGAHRLRLPGLVVVALDSWRWPTGAQNGSAAGMAHGEQGDLVVEVDEALDDHPALAGAAAFLGVVPGLAHVGRRRAAGSGPCPRSS